MADYILPSGASVAIDPEDLDLMEEGTWRAYQLGKALLCVRDVLARGHQYRLQLHREVAFRMEPALIKKADRLNVSPINGDFMDVRRANLEFRVFPRKAGAPKRARGSVRNANFKGVENPLRAANDPPAWSRAGCADAAVRGDGQGGARPVGDPVG